jgi:hypothetical protein
MKLINKKMNILSEEVKAINLFNEALINISTCQFPDLQSRKDKAKANAFLTVTNIKIALYEASEIDKIPASAYQKSEAYYSKVREIITKF